MKDLKDEQQSSSTEKVDNERGIFKNQVFVLDFIFNLFLDEIKIA